MEMIYQNIGFRKTYLEEEFVSDTEITTVFVLWPSHNEAEHLLGEEDISDNKYYVVKDVYRFYSKDDKIIRKDTYEVYYEPKRKKEDSYHIKSIKMFSSLDNGYRTDWFCENENRLTYRTYEEKSERDLYYKKYVYNESLNKFIDSNTSYEGVLSDVNLGDVSLNKINIVNEDHNQREDINYYFNEKVKIKTLSFQNNIV
jgi:hypothetical protein